MKSSAEVLSVHDDDIISFRERRSCAANGAYIGRSDLVNACVEYETRAS